MIVNLYEFLEIEPNVSLEEVLAAIAKAEADGKNPKLILASKNLLCDVQRRKKYNESLKRQLEADGVTLDFSPKPKSIKIPIANDKQALSEEQLIEVELSEQNTNEQPIHTLQKKIVIGAAIFIMMLLGLAMYYVPQYWAIRSAKIEAEQRLIDPTSHLFRDIEYHSAVIREDKRSFVCGYINAKNRMGAYTGFTGFIYSVTNKSIFHEPDDNDEYASDIFFKSWKIACLGFDYKDYSTDFERQNNGAITMDEKIDALRENYRNGKITRDEFVELSQPLQLEINELKDSQLDRAPIPNIFANTYEHLERF